MKSEEEGGLILRHKESMLITNVTEDEIEFRNSLNIDQDKFKSEKIHCTACNKNLKDKIMSKLEIYIHPALQVSVCKSCFKFYGTGAFTTDEDGTDMFCRWCGQGGELICCSRCTVVMCIKCIELNFPKEYRKETEKDDWCCFICDTKPIWPIRALAAAASEYVESQKKNQMSKRRGIDKDDAVPKKSRRNDSSESEEATEPTYSKRNKKKYEGTSSKRLRRNKSDDDEFLEPKRSSRLRRKGSREEYYTDSSSTEAKTKRRKPTSLTSDTNSNDSDSSRKGRFHKSKATTKSPRKTSRSSEEKVENESPSKNELSALLQHHIIESVADYNKLIKVMMKSRKDYVNEYLQNKKLWKNDDGKQTLIDKYKELLAKTKDSMDKLECTFLTSMKKLNLLSTKEEDETKQIAEANQILNNEMDVSSTDVETIRVNEHQSSMDPSKILDVISTDVTHTETTCESKSQQSMDSSKVLDKETDSMNVTDLETTHENENQQSMDPSRILDKGTDSMNVTDIEMTRIDDEDISNMSNEESNIFDSESNTVENQDKASDSNEIIAKKALLDSPKDPHASPSAESNTVKKQDEASDSDEIIAKKALLDSPEDPHASPGAESNTVKKQDKASDSDEIIAKKALLDSPEDPLASSNAEESENDTKASPNDTKASPSKETIAKAVQLESLKEPLVSPNEEEMAKAALLESSDADIGNDEELKSSDSASSGICKLDGNKSQQSV